MANVVWIGLAGAAGTLLRYWVNFVWLSQKSFSWPLGTWLVNIIGSFLISFLAAGLPHGMRFLGWSSEDIRLIMGVGLLGGFTTYSSFNSEVIGFIHQNNGVMALRYLFITLFACLLSGELGWFCGSLLRSRT
jgi:CrcB protein